MYKEFYQLKSKPFSLNPDPDLFFLSEGHRKGLIYLNYALRENEGYVVISGDIGAGKTTLIRTVIRNIKTADSSLAYIKNTLVNSTQMLRLICYEFGIEFNREHDKDGLILALNNFLKEQYQQNKKSILIIDEAQNLDPITLEEIRLLSNLETDKQKLIQIILVGQPQLRRKLALPELEQLSQRVSINYYLGPLKKEEIGDYVRYRLHMVGGNGIFTDETFEEIYDYSKGIPRLINILCSFSLLCGFIERKATLDLAIIKGVREDLERNRFKTEED